MDYEGTGGGVAYRASYIAGCVGALGCWVVGVGGAGYVLCGRVGH